MSSRNVFLVGENGQGKTNFLEALYYLSYGSSFRTRNDKDMLSHGKDRMWVRGKVDSEYEKSGNLSINWAEGVKTIKLHGKLLSDRQELVKRMPTIVFVHDDFLFVSGPPEKKRWFMDQTLAMYDPSYVLSLRKYRKHLRELNFLLKNRENALLDHYSEQLVDAGLDMCRRRREVTSRMEAILGPLYSEVSGIPGALSLEYRPSWKEDDSSSAIMDRLARQRENDLLAGNLGSGPHRDRFIFYFCGREFMRTASTGQQRLLSLSLRAAQARFFSESTGRKPVLLVDDVLLELDISRRLIFRKNLPEATQTVYTFLSMEDAGDLSTDSICYEVKMGEFQQYA